MRTVLIRLAAIIAMTLPLGACFAYTETARPTPVYVQSPPAGTVVVQPQPTPIQ